MQTYDANSGRLVKVLLPPALVARMDRAIEGSTAYRTRSEFVTDAVDGHLAELAVSDDYAERTPAEPGHVEEGQPILRRDPVEVRPGSPLVTSVRSVRDDVPTRERTAAIPDSPTWGMHNRDFPTVWALWHLSEAASEGGGAVDFNAWVKSTVEKAWAMAEQLPPTDFDIAGFPSNRQKRESSEGRFVKFFLGTEGGEGPLFTLGLAGIHDGRIAPTDEGVDLLRKLEGVSCRWKASVAEGAREAFLRHLAAHAPADMAFMREVVEQIEKGHATRSALVTAGAAAHPRWSRSVLETNIAGFVARSREWGLMARKQHQGKYILTPAGESLAGSGNS